MKTTLLLSILMVSFSTLFAAPNKIVATKSNGKWSNAADWNENRRPADKDSIFIPANTTMVLDYNMGLNDVIIIVKGTLVLNKGKISLDDDSRIIIEAGGRLVGGGANEQVRIDNELKYRGSMGVLYGPAYADATTGNSFFMYSILPVRFLSFDAQKKNEGILITWSTDQEKNNSHFKVERSENGSVWNSIGMVFPKEGSSVNRYSFTDKSAVGAVVYYRIRQVDVDGGSTFSKVQVIRNSEVKNLAQVFSPSQNSIRVNFAQPLESAVQIRLFSSTGQLISTKSVNGSANRADLAVNNGKGVYVVQVVDTTGSIQSSRVVL
ncbi:MAG: G8 domain-containing protein [Flavitalea sp.]